MLRPGCGQFDAAHQAIVSGKPIKPRSRGKAASKKSKKKQKKNQSYADSDYDDDDSDFVMEDVAPPKPRRRGN